MPIPQVIFVPSATDVHNMADRDDELDMFTLDLLLSGADQEEDDEMELVLQGKSLCSSPQGSSTGPGNDKAGSNCQCKHGSVHS